MDRRIARHLPGAKYMLSTLSSFKRVITCDRAQYVPKQMMSHADIDDDCSDVNYYNITGFLIISSLEKALAYVGSTGSRTYGDQVYL